MPCATITHTLPRRLHSTQTLWAAMLRRRRCRIALSDLDQLRLSIGQPRSSKSTWTWSAIGVEVASVEMYSGRRVDGGTKSSTSREVAQRLDPAGGRAGADRDQRPRGARAPPGSARRRAAVVIEPSTRERSYGPATVALDASRKYAISTLRRRSRAARPRQSSSAQLAAVAGGELPDRERRPLVQLTAPSPRAARDLRPRRRRPRRDR